MSDRMNLWPKGDNRGPFDVELSDHPDMRSAILAFANWSQVLKVFGPEDKIRECIDEWWRLTPESEWHDIPPPDGVTFVIQDTPGQCREVVSAGRK